jgi:hypothetical protein
MGALRSSIGRRLPDISTGRGQKSSIHKARAGTWICASEVKDLLALRAQAGATCSDIRRRANAKIGDIEAKIRDLHSMKAALERLAASCAGAGPLGAGIFSSALAETI